ncbi:MAG: type VII toxin-antitoxin system HepT family RNase toxin [Bacillota bacterium]
MVKKEIVLERAQKCSEYIDYLEDIVENVEFEEFKNKPTLFGSAERFLHLAIESLLDIGNHIIADDDLGKVREYRDIPEILREKGYFNKKEADLFVQIVVFRNILVHDYMDLDLDIIFELINNNLDDLRGILKSYLKKM